MHWTSFAREGPFTKTPGNFFIESNYRAESYYQHLPEEQLIYFSL